MKILVFSDSHASLGFMRKCIHALRPDCILHLGDYYDDGETIAQENPQLRFYQVPGNCDRYRCPPDAPQALLPVLEGVKIFMTHGHNHGVKLGTGAFIADARRAGAQIALYGHTHRAECYQTEDGLWVMNPGSCGYGGSVGIIGIQNNSIKNCCILKESELEDIL